MVKFFKVCALGLVSWGFPRLLVACGVPLDRWIMTLGGFIQPVINSEVALWAATVIVGIVLYCTSLLWPRIGKHFVKEKDKTQTEHKPVISLGGSLKDSSIIGNAYHPSNQLLKVGGDIEGTTVRDNNPINQIDHDVWLFDAVCRAYLGKWETLPFEFFTTKQKKEDVDRLGDIINNQIRQFAHDGKLPLWGKRSSGLWQRIPDEYWINYGVDYMSFLKGEHDPKELKTFAKTYQVFEEIWTELKTNRAKVEELWPPALVEKDRLTSEVQEIINKDKDNVTR